MARIRTIKPELFRHESLFELELETGLPIRIAFAGLFTVCDRRGRFQWRPRQLKLDVLPYDDIDFSRVLDALMTRGFVQKYENSGELYGCIPSFERHQVINNRESESELPSIEDETSLIIDLSSNSTRESRVINASATRLVQEQGEGKGREGKGREGEGNNHASTSDGVGVVFDHWRSVMGHEKSKLDNKRTALIRKALGLGYSVDDLKNAITGYSLSPFHMGENDSNTRYDGLDLILRDGSKIDAGIAFKQNPPKPKAATGRGGVTVDDFNRAVEGIAARTMHMIEG